MTTIASRAVLMQHDTDPREDILRAVRPYIGKIHPSFEAVILATYVRPEKTKGGVILSSGNVGMRAEDPFQGKTHLIIAAGPTAFEDPDGIRWGDRKPQVGDWCMIRVSDGVMFKIGDVHCRLMTSALSIHVILDEPDIIL